MGSDEKTNVEVHEFGGDWTSTKLGMLRKYLVAYRSALKNKGFRLIYVDAFAGDGYRSPVRLEEGGPVLDLEFDEPARKLLDGSASMALQLDPPFDEYRFIEKNPTRVKKLEKLRGQFAHLPSRIEIVQGDANERIVEMCRESWKRKGVRAVLFLDPYGMQVHWDTMKSIADSRAIDVWILFPLGIGVNRLLVKDGRRIPEEGRTWDETPATTAR